MSTTVYQEAIAEAKQLREIAEKNAKNAIVEAVTPRIREFIDQQLMSETSDNNTPSDSGVDEIIAESLGIRGKGDTVSLDSTAIDTLTSLLGSAGESGNIMSAIAESINSLSEEDAGLVVSAARKLSHNDGNLDASEIYKEYDELQERSTMRSNHEKVYDVDIQLLREAINEEDDFDQMFAEEDEEGSPMDAMEEDDDWGGDMGDEHRSGAGAHHISGGGAYGAGGHRIDYAEGDYLNEDKIELDLGDFEIPEDVQLVARLIVDDEEDEMEDEMDLELEPEEDVDISLDVDEEIPLEEVLTVDSRVLRQELRRMRKVIREAKDLATAKGGTDPMSKYWGGAGDSKAGLKHSFGGKGSGKGDSFGGGTAKGDPLKVKLNSLSETLRKERRRNRALAGKLDEYRGAVETLREQLTDLNLFNAKLLYVNKLLQNKNISSSKKRSMVESIDGAKSLREVKLIYKTLTSSPDSRRSLSESTARSIGSSSRVSGRSSATQATAEVDRWAQLAGLK